MLNGKTRELKKELKKHYDLWASVNGKEFNVTMNDGQYIVQETFNDEVVTTDIYDNLTDAITQYIKLYDNAETLPLVG